MFERFTTRARHSIVLAQDEARLLGHAQIGTEHVLLGLLGEPEAIAGRVLRDVGLDLEVGRREVEAEVGRGEGSPSGHIPFSPRAKKVLEVSLREALQLGHNYIGTEHLLLGLVREGDGAGMQVLALHGATSERLRPMVVAEIKRAGAGKGGESPRARRTPGADAVIAAAEQLAGSGPMGSHHLLEAMALVDDSLAGGTLGALGIAPEVLAAKIEELGTEGTTDVSPEEAAARRMELRISDDELVVVMRDPATLLLARQLAEAVSGPITGAGPAGSLLIGLWQANLGALQQLVERVDPADDGESEGEPGSRTAIVRAAIRNRLRRRSG